MGAAPTLPLPLVLPLLVPLLACSAGSPSPPRSAASISPSSLAAISPAAPSGPPAAAPSPSASPAGVAGVGSDCTGPLGPGPLVIGTVAGSSATVVRDVSNSAAGRNVCTLTPAGPWRFAGPGAVSLAQQGPNFGDAGRIVVVTLPGGAARVAASWPVGEFASGTHAWSPDGSALTYLVSDPSGMHWHLVASGTDRVIATLPHVPGRGVSPTNDDLFLDFSPDGRFIALVQTFATGGSGESAPVQVRTPAGALVYSAASGTMGVWASQPSRLFFRSSSGHVTRWDSAAGGSVLTGGVGWVRPRSSSSGLWIAYSVPAASGIPDFHLYGVQSASVSPMTRSSRLDPRFITPSLVWYQAAVACSSCGMLPYQAGPGYLFDLSSNSESPSVLTSVFDTWPRLTPPGM